MKFNMTIMASCFMLPFFLKSQNSIYTEEFNVNLNIKEANTFLGRTCASLSDGKIYFLKGSANSNQKKRVINVYDLASHERREIEFANTKDTKVLFRNRIDAFQIIDDKIIILTDPTIVVLKITKGKADFFQKTPNTKFFNYISKTSDHTVFLSVNYNFHPMDSPDKHVWANYDISKNEIVNVKKMNDENAIFSHYVNSWVSVCNNKIAYSKTAEYSIYFYNSVFEKTDSIKSNLLSSNEKYSDILSKPFEYSKDHITGIQQLDDSVLTRIQKIFYVDSAHVFVTLKFPKNRQLGIHLWEKKNGEWTLTKRDVIPSFYEAGKAYTEKNNSMTGFYGNADALIPDGKGNIYYLYSPYMDKIITPSFDMQLDYTNKLNNLIKNNTVEYGLKKFSFEAK